MDTFGERLLSARQRARNAQGKKLTQDQLAHTASVPSSAAINKYEKGRLVPRAETMKRLAIALGVSVEWLMTGGGAPGPRARGKAA